MPLSNSARHWHL